MEEQRCPTLRIYADAPADELDGRISLTDFFTRWHIPIVMGPRLSNSRTIREYRYSLGWWQRLTGDPPLVQIDAWTCSSFTTGLSRAGLSPATIAKHCRHVRSVLAKTGPRTAADRNAADLIGLPPLPDLPKATAGPPREAFTLAELSRWLLACEHATAPADEPVLWWRALVLVLYNTGWRISTALKFRRSWISRESWGHKVQIPPEAWKGGRGKVLPLSEHVVELVDRFAVGRDLVFPCPHRDAWIHTLRRRMLARAGIRQLGFHAVRRLFANQLEVINPELVSWLLGHASNVARRHYLSWEHACNALSQLPQPRADDCRQLTLF